MSFDHSPDTRFDTVTDRRGTQSSKWDYMEKYYGVSPGDGLAMWTADSDYPTPACVTDALQRAVDHGIFGYYPVNDEYLCAIQWWMKTRHDWPIDTDWILTTQGLGHAIGMALDVWSAPQDDIVIFSPVYHEFRNKVEKAGRRVTECPLKRVDDTYVLDLEDAQNRLSGRETMLLWCSPQNPSGRVWSVDELRAIAAFAAKNKLLLISDEVHHDLVYPGNRFVPMHVAAPEQEDRMVILTSASKTFNIAGQRTGNMIIPDAALRKQMQDRLNALDYKPAGLSLLMITAAYSPAGAEWVDAQLAYLADNRALFDAAVDAIPGVHSLPLCSTYLAWVDFSGTGMSYEEVSRRVLKDARIAPSAGPEFGAGGETFLRFNLAAPRATIKEACERLTAAFSDLQ
ncbi:Cystathionine beta-lyase PatB [Roseobacter fucihabitans]|uniref:cysteine-S-conjugate beta-lyase n=1 Tax=Roseobacter fucihabitans TaxID=1537242 RepID=A0ABZ2BMW4_9RHOB|nr:PatB family C-S lyase [Roseobacter litoralis]MBC6964618.1 Cystathionine beta-lyase PatB [Roseobacter litoralis]